MIKNELYFLFIINLLIFIVGYILGNLKPINISSNQNSFFKKIESNKNKIDSKIIGINESKVVTKIKTDGLDKKYDSLGETKQSQDNILSSVGKLKGLKK